MNHRRMLHLTVAGAMIAGGAIAWTALAGAGAPGDNTKPTTPAMRPATPAAKTLFDRLGGTYAIAAVIDDFITRLAADPVVMANPQVKAAVDKAIANHGLPGLNFQVTAFVIQATGGPYKYHGKTMKESHKDLKINQSEWDAGVGALKATLEKFKVPKKEQDELIAIVATTHDDIVMPAMR
jgi:hemoglobin